MEDYTQRNLLILKLRQDGETLHSIGRQFGISRERVRQILKSQRMLMKCKGMSEKELLTYYGVTEEHLKKAFGES